MLKRHLGMVVLSLGCVLAGWRLSGQAAPVEHWYRGNTHAHTILCGHADSEPEVVAAWYLDHGYHFLILSEHNRFIDPATVTLPKPRRADFILIPGEEVTGNQSIHLTAMNIHQLIPWDFNDPSKTKIVQTHINNIQAAGGLPVVNHPNWNYTLTAEDLAPIQKMPLFELFNGHPDVHNTGDATHASTEAIWDKLLSQGKVLYGVSSDDAHTFKSFAADQSNPGRGWVMVQAPALTPDAITTAMRAGHFYASNGVYLKTIEHNHSTYALEVDVDKTRHELGLPEHRGRLLTEAGQGTLPEGVMIDFIGEGGKILSSVQGTKASFALKGLASHYVRARVTWVHKHPERGLEAFYAWGQPEFQEKQ